ncbi:MAG: type II secretion system protein [Armatimonadetes bacterium]|nr:type II secretion system protein [Armatimonadota bacterium]MDE2206948.1 type II secretion system protein [Armatimonadota bacterium]
MLKPADNRSLSAFSLIELLVVCVILVALGAGLSAMLIGHAKPGSHQAATPMDRAQSVVCMNNLNQIRDAIAAAEASDPNGAPPATLASLKLPVEMTQCPLDHSPYKYDPVTGQVHCTYPGHEKY